MANGARDFDGTVDDVRIYNRPLEAREVRSLYAWGPGPVGYWNLDENTGGTANDTSGNGLTGTFYTTSSAAITAEETVIGGLGDAVRFKNAAGRLGPVLFFFLFRNAQCAALF